MRVNWHFGSVLLAAAFAIPGCEPRNEAPATNTAAAPAAMSDKDMLDAQLDAFEKAWEGGDAKAIAALFATGGDFVDPSGTMFDGREAIEKRYQDLLGSMYKGTKIAITMSSSHFPSPDVAISNGDYAITGMKTADGSDVPAVKGLYTNVSVKEGGEWKIHCSRPMIPVPAPAK
jgi:uncharacterized protein (TIGR02246 family)